MRVNVTVPTGTQEPPAPPVKPAPKAKKEQSDG